MVPANHDTGNFFGKVYYVVKGSYLHRAKAPSKTEQGQSPSRVSLLAAQ
jgi:hypothetical protein